jgi:hypothetical protein
MCMANNAMTGEHGANAIRSVMKAIGGIYTSDNHGGKTLMTAIGGGTIKKGDYKEGYSMMRNQEGKLMVI